MSQAGFSLDECFRGVACVTEAVCRLPAIATLDWTDRAALALTALASPSRACVMICSADPAGSVTHHEATGVASSAGHGRHSGDDTAPDLTLRSRGERLDSIGARIEPAMLRSGHFDTLDRLLATAEWRGRGIGRMWAGVPAGEVVVGLMGLGEIEPGRMMIAMLGVGTSASDDVRARRVAQMRVVFPRLVLRALQAIGARRTTAGRWLTAREQEVLEELKLGKSVRQIADEIGRSPHTVHDHVKSLHRKLNASSRGELVARALGYIDESGRVVPAAAEAPEDGPEIMTTGADVGALRRPVQAARPLSIPHDHADGRPSIGLSGSARREQV